MSEWGPLGIVLTVWAVGWIALYRWLYDKDFGWKNTLGLSFCLANILGMLWGSLLKRIL